MCLLAIEENTVKVVKENLEKMFFDITFQTCSFGQKLKEWTDKGIDILVISRFIPKGDMTDEGFLRYLRVFFPRTHIILLAGTESEARRIYIEQAEQYSITSIVKGVLPGDKPYTIFEALKEAEELVIQTGNEYMEEPTEPLKEEGLVWAEDFEIEEPIVEIAKKPIPEVEREKGISQSHEEPDFFKKMGLDTNPILTPIQHNTNQPKRNGILVVPSSNKGGVGKTTTGISLAVVLANMGIPTIVSDYDFGSPDVATFFNIKNVPGIEKLSKRNIRAGVIEDLLVEVRPNLTILPGPMDKTLPYFEPEQLVEIIRVLQSMFSVVVCDTPPEFWTKPWLAPVFSMADYVLAVVDQSKFSLEETKSYAPYMLSMGAKPENIHIILNRFNSKLHNVRTVEKIFCSGFKKDVKPLPKVSVVIPEDWEAHAREGYKGEVAGVDGETGYVEWHKLATEIAEKTGFSYEIESKTKKTGRLGGLFGRRR